MKKGVRIGITSGIILLALAVTVFLVLTRKKPGRQEPESRGVLVWTEKVHRGPHRFDVRAQGTIIPAQEVVVQPQVSGLIVELNPDLVPGGILRRGELVVRIDPSDYEVAVDDARTALERAQAELELERGQQRIAQREWELFQGEAQSPTTDSSLALREPQLRSAEAAVGAARARLDRAELDLNRTRIEAPFDCFVRVKSVDIGAYVTPQTAIATLVGTEAFWMRASVPASQVIHLAVPGFNSATGSVARVSYDLGERAVEREGRVIRLFRDLDPAGRMARLLIEIPDPLSLNGESDREPAAALLLDAFVDVTLFGRTVEELVEVPRQAVHEGNEVFVLGEDGMLEIREAEIVWRLPETVLVRKGVEDGDRVVVSRISTPVEGMKLRMMNDE